MNTQQDEITGCIIRFGFCLLWLLGIPYLRRCMHAVYLGLTTPISSYLSYQPVKLVRQREYRKEAVQKRRYVHVTVCLVMPIARGEKGVGKLLMRIMEGTITGSL